MTTTAADTRALDELSVNTIRTLSMDAVQAANSGHPGAPMGLAPLAYVLYTRVMRHNPADPDWPNRDRFVLSAGHASMLLYSMLYLTGYPMTLDDLRNFRQVGAPTAGHPERKYSPGIEATTGPLGQGIAMAAGMALGERMLAAQFNVGGHEIVNHNIFTIASDGDIQEGVAAEASSLAGHLKLGKLIAFYDDNKIQLASEVEKVMSEDVAKRYEAYGWHVVNLGEEDDLDRLETVTREAMNVHDAPSLILLRTHIGHGSPNKQDTTSAHGSPLGEDEVRATKENLGWDPDRQFYVPDDVREQFERVAAQGNTLINDWEHRVAAYRDTFPDRARELDRRIAGEMPRGWDSAMPEYATGTEMATRNASQETIQAIAGPLPELFGGAADLSESNLTIVKGGGDFGPDEAGRNLWFGVREHGMGGTLNGIAYHGGFIPYGGTFLTFSDYMRGSVRLAALSDLHVIYVWTHDSIGLGEDGPTHQAVEHYAALRAIPNLWFVRPGDANETVAAWAVAATRRGGPVGLSLTRQKLPVLDGTAERARDGVARGGYVLRDAEGGKPDVILIGTGSELQLAAGAAEALGNDGIPARVVSLPCWELFEQQEQAYRDEVLPPDVRKRVSVEAGVSLGWERWVGDEGAIVGLDHFGASAPAGTVFKEFGFTVERVTDVARQVLRDGLHGRVPTLHPGHLGLGGQHPSLGTGDPGVNRSGNEDPGHS